MRRDGRRGRRPRARDGDADDAERRLSAASALCPSRGRPARELAALRFRDERWLEAAALASRATRLEADDPHAWRLLGTSLYLGGRPADALRAWNRIGEPTIDSVALTGLERSRHDAVIAYAGLGGGGSLRPGPLARARRRLEELPAAARARTSYTPLGDGRARVDASLVERPLIASLRLLALKGAADALTERQTSLRLDGLGRVGDALELGGRWWERRPAVWLEAAVPRGLGLPGLLHLELRWEEQSYRRAAEGAPPLVESRRRAAASTSDWLTPSLRWSLGVAGERWSGRSAAASAFLALDQRLADDRVSALGRVEVWAPLGEEPGYAAWSGRVAVRSSARPRRLAAAASVGFHAASADAPLALWPGAGVGHARPLLLRSQPLLEGGVVAGPAFGRRLLRAGGELELTVARPGPLRVGVAGFFDWVRVSDSLRSPDPAVHAAAGGGVRLHVSEARALRVDAATDPDAGGLTLSAGWQLAWP